MRQFLAWLARSVLLPLLPMIAGSLIRSVYSGTWSLDSIDAGELAFCVALIGVITLTGVNRLHDRALRDALAPLFVITLVMALSLFAGATLMRLVHDAEQRDLLLALKSAPNLSSASLLSIGLPDRCTRTYDQIRSATLVTALITVLLAVIARIRYLVDEEDLRDLPSAASLPSEAKPNA